MPGSSPLTRGKPRHRTTVAIEAGLIPAHAGKTATTPAARQHPRAHPRSRGENHPGHQATASRMGSSPLTRGKRRKSRAELSNVGLIPAHAGKTLASVLTLRSTVAHPRSRGENALGNFISCLHAGSSPLTRGKRQVGGERVLGSGLIPAHAGKTPWASTGLAHVRAHPRSRGENLRVGVDALKAQGSSPLTRGKPVVTADEGSADGLIPAHAGKTLVVMRGPPGSWAHPRSRGENLDTRERGRSSPGSSPLTRGKRE